MRIGIVRISNPEKGLAKSADTLHWALRQHDVSLFRVAGFGGLYRDPDDRFFTWARACDVVVLIEQFLPRAVERLREGGTRVVFVPNLDWAVLLGDPRVSTWVAAVRSSGADVWARTPATRNALAEAGIPSRMTGWSASDEVCRERSGGPGRSVTFFMNAGRGGWRRRRGADLAIAAFRTVRARHPRARLILKTLRPVSELAGDAPLGPSVSVIQGWRTPAEMRRLLAQADVVLHPSRWEGLGHPMLEALHAGIPVVATDGWPMNEFVEHERTGLLVPARRVGTTCLAPHWECDPGDLAAAMARLVSDRALRNRLTCGAPDVWLQRQQAFPTAAMAALADPPVSVPNRAPTRC